MCACRHNRTMTSSSPFSFILLILIFAGLVAPGHGLFWGLFGGRDDFFPDTRYTEYSDLTDAEKNATMALGYDEATWNLPGRAVIEAKPYSNLTEDEMDAAETLGLTNEGHWDCWINHYAAYGWSELREVRVQIHLRMLGWNRRKWEGGGNPPRSEDEFWDDLWFWQSNAAGRICFFKETWDGEAPIGDWPEGFGE